MVKYTPKLNMNQSILFYTSPNGITDSMDMSLSMLQKLLDKESLRCYSPWRHKESDMYEHLNWTELKRNSGAIKLQKNMKET